LGATSVKSGARDSISGTQLSTLKCSQSACCLRSQVSTIFLSPPIDLARHTGRSLRFLDLGKPGRATLPAEFNSG